MKNLFKISLSTLLLFCLFSFGACANMHRSTPSEDSTVKAVSSDVAADSVGQSCGGAAGAKGGCNCAQCKGGEHKCQGKCSDCKACSGCKGQQGCATGACGKGKEGGCGHCGQAQGLRGGAGSPGSCCGK